MTTSPDLGTGACAPDRMRALMAGFPTGVSVVTAVGAGGAPLGMTCSSLCSVTLSPPTLLVCLRGRSPTLAAVRASGRFAVNLLHADARATAELFASGAVDRFDRVRWRTEPGGGGPHLYTDAHSVGDCRVTDVRPVGDHAVVLGEVVRVTQWPAQPPLLYGLRRYATWNANTR
ncbi:flavin reductase family protein [Saccharothrix obliqua]|uniref:flavin reductase family protein n=1 Tax=Saccharothrix obliqua TaxID=2861747 RepID=UPI001C5F089D|nr:flavin reductase family protein [Saccharothrix obliqua]MBW4720431.1 flavin reductase family protein [Saccharothrix obliqua]